tara:strand:+ start:376 stop:609 length:234 start_codon:yes stop_codon:yes gene_type:complete
MTIKTITQTNTVSEKFDREEYDQGTHEIEDQTNVEMKKMTQEKNEKPEAVQKEKKSYQKSKYDWTITSYWGTEEFEF